MSRVTSLFASTYSRERNAPLSIVLALVWFDRVNADKDVILRLFKTQALKSALRVNVFEALEVLQWFICNIAAD